MTGALPLVAELADAYRARQVQWDETSRLRQSEMLQPRGRGATRQEVCRSEDRLKAVQRREAAALEALVVWYEQQLGGVMPEEAA